MKKLFTVILALALVLSFPLTALATPPTGDQNSTGTGDVEYVDVDIYSAIIPTTNSFNFQLDPLGLLDIDEGDSALLKDLKGGGVHMASPARVINNSAYDLKVSVALTVTTEGTGPTAPVIVPYGADDTATIAAVTADTAPNILLYAAPANGRIINTTTPFTAGPSGYVLGSSALDLVFVLGAADYTITNTAGVFSAAVVANTGHGSAITLGGLCNPRADWKDFVGATPDSEVGVAAVFTLAKATVTESETAPVTGFYGLITAPTAGFMTLIPPTPGFASPATGGTSINAGTYNAVAGTLWSTPFNFYGNTPSGFTIGGTAFTPDVSMFNVSANTISFTFASAGTRAYTFIVNGVTFSFTVNVAAA